MSRRSRERCRLQIAAVALTLAAASSASAADTGFYFGLNIGRSDFDASGSDVVALAPGIILFSGGGPVNTFVPRPAPGGAVAVFGLAAPTTSVDERDTTFSGTVGYTLNRYLSFEASYADLGEVEASSVTTFNTNLFLLAPLISRVDQKIETETFTVSVLGTLPLSERWSLFARGGYAFSESEVTTRSSFVVSGGQDTIPAQGRGEFDSDDFVVGAGVGFKLSSRISLRADYAHMFDAATNGFGADIDIDTFGLSAIFRL